MFCTLNTINIYSGSIIQTKHVVFKNIYVLTHMHIIINIKRPVNFKEIKESCMGGFGERKKEEV